MNLSTAINLLNTFLHICGLTDPTCLVSRKTGEVKLWDSKWTIFGVYQLLNNLLNCTLA